MIKIKEPVLKEIDLPISTTKIQNNGTLTIPKRIKKRDKKIREDVRYCTFIPYSLKGELVCFLVFQEQENEELPTRLINKSAFKSMQGKVTHTNSVYLTLMVNLPVPIRYVLDIDKGDVVEWGFFKGFLYLKRID